MDYERDISIPIHNPYDIDSLFAYAAKWLS